jgi:hypothetical protein
MTTAPENDSRSHRAPTVIGETVHTEFTAVHSLSVSPVPPSSEQITAAEIGLRPPDQFPIALRSTRIVMKRVHAWGRSCRSLRPVTA